MIVAALAAAADDGFFLLDEGEALPARLEIAGASGRFPIVVPRDV